jgi:hypothetical protein
MGWSMCYIAVKNKSECDVLKNLRLQTTAKTLVFCLPENEEIIGFVAEEGWYVLLATEPDFFNRKSELRELSKTTDVILGQEMESTAYSWVCLLKQGHEAWELNYEGWKAGATITVKGIVPEYVQRMIEDSAKETGSTQYEVALSAFKAITGIDWKSYGSLRPIADAKHLSLEQ